MSTATHTLEDRQCLGCNKPLSRQQLSRKAKYCSRKCGYAATRGRPKLMLRNRVVVKCKQCHQLFECRVYEVLSEDRKFCSQECSKRYHKTHPVHKPVPRIALTCQSCGVTFRVRKTDHQKYPRKHCSQKCKHEAQRGTVSFGWLKKYEQWDNVECTQCGVRFHLRKSVADEGGPCFCSKSCRAKHKKITLACEHCGASFSRYKSHTKKSKHVYCSLKCKLASRAWVLDSKKWLGGSSFVPYPPEFSKKLKQAIRKRDGHCCVMCGRSESEFKEKLHVHHIDYNKKNNHPWNLCSLDQSCHGFTNSNRFAWTEFFRIVNDERGFKPKVVRKEA